MSFSVRLKELRTDSDMYQGDLAERLNLKTSAISKYERGLTQPSIETLIAIAKIFNVTVDYLVGNSDVKNPEIIDKITSTEARLIERFRKLSNEDKIRIDERILAMTEKK